MAVSRQNVNKFDDITLCSSSWLKVTEHKSET